MIQNLKVVRVNTDYCDYLRKFDNKVAYNKNEKELRPFIGILFEIDTCKYFAPLSSPKPKHRKMKNSVDFFKIKNGELGAVNFNNMIPVGNYNYSLIDLNREALTVEELKYQKLLKSQLQWLNANYNQVKNKSFKLYQLYNEGKLSNNIKERCCNFKMLEQKSLEYNEIDKKRKEKPMDKKLKIITEKCPQNHKCPAVSVCPVGALTQKDFEAPQIDHDKCIKCGKCSNFCPKKALVL